MIIRNVAKSVVLNPAGEVLLLRRSMTDPRRPGEWDFPGGGVEDGESHAEGAARELEEEAGIRVLPTNLRLLYTKTQVYESENQSINRSLFAVRVGEAAAHDVQLSFEHDLAKWLPVDEALEAFPHPFYGAGLRYALEHNLLP